MAYKVGDRVVTDGGGYDNEDGTPVEYGRVGTVTNVVYDGAGEVDLYDVIVDGLPADGSGVGGGLAFFPTEIVGREGEV